MSDAVPRSLRLDVRRTRITLAHFSVSSAMSLPKSAGETGKHRAPKSASRALILGSARPALISLLSLSTISAGVFLGAPTPYQRARLVARHEIAHGRNVRQRLRARRGGHRQRAQLAGPDVLDRRRHGGEHDLHLPAEQIGERGRRAAIGHVDHVDAGHHLEQLAGHMGRGPVAGRRHVDLARIGLGIGDELGNRLGRNRWIDHHDVGHAA